MYNALFDGESNWMKVITEVVLVFELPCTDLGYARAAGLAVLLGREDILVGYHRCPVCGALIRPEEFTNPIDGKPDVAYGACPNGHDVITQLEAMADVTAS